MPNYKYKAINSAGKTVEGIHTAHTKDEVITMLRNSKYYPTSVNEYTRSKDIKQLELFNRVKLKDIAVFCRQFHAMLNAGVSIINCLDILRQQIENKRLRTVTDDVYDSLQRGLTFSEALRQHSDVYPELLINMIAAGEASGNLDTIMDRMAVHYEKEEKIGRKIKSAMIYPIVLGIIAVIVVVLLLVFIFPTFLELFNQIDAELPELTKLVMTLSNSIKNYWYIYIITIVTASYTVRKLMKLDSGIMFFDELKFKLPVVKGTVTKIYTSRFSRTMSTLLSSGMPLLQALDLVSKIVGNKVVERGILIARDEVRKGINLAEPIKRIGVFPPMLVSMLSIGEESGALDDMLERTANFYDSEVESAIDNMTKLLEPLMLVVMAVFIGFIVVAMILPMFDIMSKLQY